MAGQKGAAGRTENGRFKETIIPVNYCLPEQAIRSEFDVLKPIIISSRSTEDLASRLDQQSAQMHRPGLALVFAQDRILSPRILKVFKDRNIPVFGSCAAEPIYQDQVVSDGIVTLLLDLPTEAYRLEVFAPEPDQVKLGRTLGKYMRAAFADPSLLLLVAPGDLEVSPEPVLQGIFQESPDAAVYGAVPSSFGLLERPPFFTNSEIIEAGLYALVLDGAYVRVEGMAVSGWKELGTPKRITRSRGREVQEIEGVPATEFYSRYFDLKPSEDSPVMNHIDPELMAAGEYPLLLRSEDGTEVMRAAIQMDGARKTVTFGGDIPEGSLVRFCSPNSLETIEHSVSEMELFRDSLQTGADAILMFNCALRSRSFGQYMQKELEAIHRLWDLPLAGFSSWGEIGRTSGQACGLHNTVISVVALRFRESPGHTREEKKQHRFAAGEVRSLVEGAGSLSIESMQAELNQLRREKRILGHFLRLTAGDLEREQKKSDELLLNILPASIAERLKAGSSTISDGVEQASILFADLVGFTKLSAHTEPAALVDLLNEIFTEFDGWSQRLGVEKIKTIGDAYMAAAGLPEPAEDHASRCLALAGRMMEHMQAMNAKHGKNLMLRVGIHSGPVAAGVIGTHKFSYDIWGDTVNTAQRMESHGEPGCIQVSEETYELLGRPEGFEQRRVELKGKGLRTAYLMKWSGWD